MKKNSKLGILSNIEKKKSKEKISLEDIASSSELKRLLEGTAFSLLKKHKRDEIIHHEIFYDELNPLTACTDGNRCLINAANGMFTEDPEHNETVCSIEESLARILGAGFHELGHVLYTCFSELRRNVLDFEKGVISKPENLSKEELDSFKEIESLMKENKKGISKEGFMGMPTVIPIRNFLISLYTGISNCVEDGRIENLLLKGDSQFKGMTSGLKTLRDYHKKSLGNCPMDDTVEGYMNLILGYSKYHYVGTYTGGFQAFENSKKIIDQMLLCVEAKDFSDGVIKLILNIWPMIKEKLAEAPEEGNGGNEGDSSSSSNQNSSSGNGFSNSQKKSSENSSEEPKNSSNSNNDSSSSNGSSDALKELEEIIKKTFGEENKPNETNDEESTEAKKKDASEAIKNISNNINNSESSNNESKSSLEGIIKKLLDEEIEKIGRTEKKKEMDKNSKALIPSLGRGFKAYEDTIFTNPDPSPDAKRILIKTDKALGSSVRKASREIERHFETDMRCKVSKNKFNGKKFYANKVCNKDFRYFGDKGRNKNVPNMSVGIVIDESGSMSQGERYTYARNAAIALYEIFENISQMDVAIYGHSTYGNNVQIFSYTDFGVKEKNVKEKLTSISARSGNIDVVPISLMAEKLLKQESEIKLLFVITDGLPYSFVTGKTPEQELTEIADKYTKKGVEIVVAAMGKDEERIGKIYQHQRFLPIDNPSELPKKLVNVIKRKL